MDAVMWILIIFACLLDAAVVVLAFWLLWGGHWIGGAYLSVLALYLGHAVVYVIHSERRFQAIVRERYK